MATAGSSSAPDGGTLYFSDTAGRRILAYELSGDPPRLLNRRLFAAMSEDEGSPDGLIVDAAGDVWCALYGAGRIAQYAPDGGLEEVHRLPCPAVTSCCFGGPELSTLYVTTGWSPAESQSVMFGGGVTGDVVNNRSAKGQTRSIFPFARYSNAATPVVVWPVLRIARTAFGRCLALYRW